MKKIMGIRSLALTCCAVGVLTASGQVWAIDNCTQITAQNESDVDSVADDKTGADAATTFNNILAAYNTDPDDTASQANDDEDCVALTVIYRDFGDAPDDYGTLDASGAGAQHQVVAGLRLGELIDEEITGVPGVEADGDDLTDADEDGVIIPVLIAGQASPVITVTPYNNTGAEAYVACWIDYDGNKTFDAGEYGTTENPVPAGFNAPSTVSGVPDTLTITMPAVPTDVATADALGSGFDSYARCRLSNVAPEDGDAAGTIADANGISDGEVEDYPVDFVTENVFDLALQKTTTQVGSVKPGATVTFDVKVINQGTVAAEDIIITDYIPAGLTLVDNAGGDGTGSGTDAWTVSGDGLTATLKTAFDLASGAEATVQINFTVDEDIDFSVNDPATLTNTAEISEAYGVGTDSNGQPLVDIDSTPDAFNTETPVVDDEINDDAKNGVDDPNNPDGQIDEDDHDIASITVDPLVDLELAKQVMNKAGTAPITEAYRGDEIMYVLTATNNGPSDATGVVINDLLPAGVTYSSHTASGTTTYAPDNTNGNEGDWTIGDLADGETVTLNISVTID